MSLPGYDDWLDNYGNPGIMEVIENTASEMPDSFIINLPVDEHLIAINDRWPGPIKVVIEGKEYLTSGYWISERGKR